MSEAPLYGKPNHPGIEKKISFVLKHRGLRPQEVIQANRIKGVQKGVYGNEDVQSAQHVPLSRPNPLKGVLFFSPG